MERQTSKQGTPPIDLPIGSKVPPILLYFHPSMKELAEEVVKTIAQERPAKTSIDEADGMPRLYRGVELKESIEWERFRDGWPNIMIKNVEEIAGRDVIFLASLHSPDTILFEQLSLMYAFPRYLVRSFRVILPFFPTATMERIDKEGQVVTAKPHKYCVHNRPDPCAMCAKTLALMLSAIPLAARGPTQLVIFDIHALQERFYFSNQVIPRLLSAMPLLQKRLESVQNCDNISIVFPDDGAHKRFNSFFPTWPTVVCNKVREGDKRIVTIRDGDARGKDCVIVDDLVQTGGTLLECVKALDSKKPNSISIFVTHAVFPQESWKKFITTKCGEIKKFWITDSIPHAVEIAKNEPFELISLSESISDCLFGYDLLSHTQ